MTLLADRQYATFANAIVSIRFTPNGPHFEPQRTSVRASRLGISCESGPHAIALRLRNYKVSAIVRQPNGPHFRVM